MRLEIPNPEIPNPKKITSPKLQNYRESLVALAMRGGIATVGDMPMTLEQIVEETAQWPVDTVAELLDRVALAKIGGMSGEHTEAWGETALRRCAELDSGQTELIPGADASARIRKIVGR